MYDDFAMLILVVRKTRRLFGAHTYTVDSAYVVATIGAAAGLAAGLGSALIALGVARSQDANARELQRRQWFADSLRECYSQVGGTHRQFMLAWWDWWDESSAGRKHDQHGELMRAVAAFAAACAAVRMYAPEPVVEKLMNLKKFTDEFDAFAEENRDRERWTQAQNDKYERLRKDADDAMPVFIKAARDSIQEILIASVSRSKLAPARRGHIMYRVAR